MHDSAEYGKHAAGTFLKQTLLLLEHWPAFDEFDHSISLISLSILHSNKYIFYACIALLLSMRAPITFAIINSIIINNFFYFVLKIYATFSSVIDQWIKKNTFKSTRVLRVMSIHTTTTKTNRSRSRARDTHTKEKRPKLVQFDMKYINRIKPNRMIWRTTVDSPLCCEFTSAELKHSQHTECLQ